MSAEKALPRQRPVIRCISQFRGDVSRTSGELNELEVANLYILTFGIQEREYLNYK